MTGQQSIGLILLSIGSFGLSMVVACYLWPIASARRLRLDILKIKAGMAEEAARIDATTHPYFLAAAHALDWMSANTQLFSPLAFAFYVAFGGASPSPGVPAPPEVEKIVDKAREAACARVVIYMLHETFMGNFARAYGAFCQPTARLQGQMQSSLDLSMKTWCHTAAGR